MINSNSPDSLNSFSLFDQGPAPTAPKSGKSSRASLSQTGLIGGPSGEVPDVTGLTRLQAIATLDELGITWLLTYSTGGSTSGNNDTIKEMSVIDGVAYITVYQYTAPTQTILAEINIADYQTDYGNIKFLFGGSYDPNGNITIDRNATNSGSFNTMLKQALGVTLSGNQVISISNTYISFNNIVGRDPWHASKLEQQINGKTYGVNRISQDSALPSGQINTYLRFGDLPQPTAGGPTDITLSTGTITIFQLI